MPPVRKRKTLTEQQQEIQQTTQAMDSTSCIQQVGPSLQPVLDISQAALYNKNIYQQCHTYAQKQQQNVHLNVKFKRLPFFDVIAELLKPSLLVLQNSKRIQEGQFEFHLTPEQATDVANSRNIRPGSKCEYIKQVQLRFCLLKTTCEQEDSFPRNVEVMVNNKLCLLPKPPHPLNITAMVKLSPTLANEICVLWDVEYECNYAITVTLVHKHTSNDLLQRLKSRDVKHSDHTRGLIKEKLNEDADGEIVTTCLQVSLMCPLGKMRMNIPCRSITCGHLQCFDASLFLQMNERKPTWNCPVCDKPALYDNLVIDGYFQDVLGASSTELSEIQLHRDGSWSTQTAEKVEKVLISDDVEVVSAETNQVESSSTKKIKEEPAPAKEKEVLVDLTVSDSDDDEPLAKRRAINPKNDSTIKSSVLDLFRSLLS